MQGAVAIVVKRNIRRVGITATKRGRPNPQYARSIFEGPTAERIAKAEKHFTVGDDKRGTRVYHFLDSPLDRLYGRLAKGAKRRGEEEAIRSEYTALVKYRHHWHASGLETSPKSVDLDRVFSVDPSGMSGMAKSERQAFHRQMHRKAAEKLGHSVAILLDNFICYEWDSEIASGLSPYLFRKTIRDAARTLAKLWGVG
jgi:hypothetical protein